MIIDAISDLHGHKPRLPGGDVLIIAGDCTARDLGTDWMLFGRWLENLNYRSIILVGGNHDEMLEYSKKEMLRLLSSKVIYLEDSGCEIDNVKFWGSPFTPKFGDWCFSCERGEEIRKHWCKIPTGLDILVTHGPPKKVLDTVFDFDVSKNVYVGCQDLRDAILRAMPRTAIFGHCHQEGGRAAILGDTRCYNVSCVNEDYELVRGETRISLDQDDISS